MRWTTILTQAVLLVSVTAFPTPENIARYFKSGSIALAGDGLENTIRDLQSHQSKRLLFNPLTKPIDVKGRYEWQQPNFAAGAQRGPCPGLNALANHGYLSRDGVAGFAEVIAVMNKVYGMGIDLGTVLAVMGTVYTGDPLSLTPGFSLDGYSSKVSNLLGNLLGLLGKPRGIGRSHNWLEADASLTRDDLYVTGDASTMNMNKFRALHDRADNNGIISTYAMVEHSLDGLKECKETNPYCWYGPYTGMIARNAGITFAARLLSNHSRENPDGIMTQETLRSMWGVVKKSDGSLEYKRGWERIPENWYRIPVDYGLVGLNLDLVDWFSKYPELLSIGGNTGTVNSFTVLDISDMTGGVMNVQKLLEGNNLVCFVLQVVKAFSPDSLSSLYSTLGRVLSVLTDVLGSTITDLSCSPFQDLEYGGQPLWKGIVENYAGPAKAGSAL